MISNKLIRFVSYYFLFFLLINLAWLGYLHHEQAIKYNKITAKVVDVSKSTSAGRHGFVDSYDVSFSYRVKNKDYSYESSRSFNSITKPLWGVKQGDVVPLYYERSDANNSLPVRSQDYGIITGLPLFIASIPIPLIAVAALFIVGRRRFPNWL